MCVCFVSLLVDDGFDGVATHCPLTSAIAHCQLSSDRREGDVEATAAVGPILALPCPLFFILMGSILRFHFEAFPEGGRQGGRASRGATFEHHAPQISMYARMHNCFEITTQKHTHTHTDMHKHALACIYMHKHALAVAFFRFVSFHLVFENETRIARALFAVSLK